MVLGLAQLDHAYQMTLDVATGNEFHEVCTGKPAVNEQIVETDTSLDGILHHLDGLVQDMGTDTGYHTGNRRDDLC